MERSRFGSLVLTFTVAYGAITIGAGGCSSNNSPAGPGSGSAGRGGGGGVPSVGRGGAGGGGGIIGGAGTGGGVVGVGGATGTGGQGQGCALPAGPAGSWVEVAPPAGQDGFRVTDIFAVGANDLLFAGRTFDPLSTAPAANARVLRWTQGCWSVELMIPASTAAPDFVSVNGTGPGDIWAAGSDLLFHRDAQGWSRFSDESWRGLVRQPPMFGEQLQFHRVRAAGANDLWAAVSSNILHWNGSSWTDYNFDDPGYPTISASIGFGYRDIWIDSPTNVWVAGGSDEIGNTMDLGFVHHFDGTNWTHTSIGLSQVEAIWRGGSVLWLANPTQAIINGQQMTATMRAFDGTNAPAVTMIGMDPNNPPAMNSLFGRGASDIWAAGDDVAHFDGQNWSLASDAPAAAHSTNDEHNTHVGGDAGSIWLATPGPHFFRKVTGP